MPIVKLTPRQIDSDADNKTISKVSMLDALNLYSGPDNDSLTIVEGELTKSDAGNGILKNIKGNKEILGDQLPAGSRVIGGVEDKKTRITYIFVYHQNASNQGVFAYDSEGLLPNSDASTLRKIYKSSQFNFPQNGFVKADIVYSSAVRTFEGLGEDFEKDAIIYFTDGVNEPRKINAYRAFQAGDSIHGNDEFAEADFITACPKTRLKPITFIFDSDPDALPADRRSVNNFEKSPGFQFAYQHVYIDGMESAISSYSDLAVLTSVVDQGSQSYVEHLNYRCLLTIPEAGPEIEKIRILGKQGNTGSFLIIDEIESSEEPQEYAFFNDRVLKGVSTDEVNKQFDSLPRKAKSQSVTSNRLMYGNYLDGFDKSGTTATATVVYLDRPEDFIDFDIKDIPSIDRGLFSESEFGFVANENQSNITGESAGFFLDYSSLPNFMPAGTQVNVNFSFKPQKNFHYYRAGTAGQTRQRGPQPFSTDDETFSQVNFEQSYAVSSTQNGSENFPSNSSTEDINADINAANSFIWGLPLDSIFDAGGSGNNFGAGNFTNWERKENPTVNGNALEDGFPAEVTEATFGTSAAAPFIFEGQTISFSASFNFTDDVENAQDLIKETVEACFTKSSPLSPAGVEILSSNNESSYNIDLGLSSGSVITQNYVGQDAGYDVNCSRIVAVANNEGTTVSGVPCGFFIVNKATPTFRLQKNLNPGQSLVDYPDNATRSHFTFRLTGFDCNPSSDVLTCIHDTADTTFGNNAKNEWLCISALDLDALFDNSYGGSGIFDWIANTPGLGQSVADSFHGFGNTPAGGGTPVPTINSLQGYGQQIGRILANPGQAFIQTSVAGLGGVLGGIGGVGGGEVQIIASPHSLMDGEGGPGGGPARAFASDHPYDALRMNKQGSVTVNPFVIPGPSLFHLYHHTVFYGGYLSPHPLATGNNFREATILPFLKNTSTSFLAKFEYQIPEGDEEFGALNSDSVNFKRNQSILEQQTLNPVTILNSDGLGFGRESFKTEANHDFGIVYYDERGRHGFVDHLATAFVEGYTIIERGGENTGAVNIELVLQGTPPDWAHTYKIVYAKNSSVQDFVQYSVGSAFVGGDPNDDEVSEANKNIYVSLNYLQGHPVSYVSSFGARTPEGGLNFYKFERGDKLKVISHGAAEGRIFHSHEFDVVDLVDLGFGDENPLSNDPSSNQVGQFVVLKDSPNANGFNHNSVAFGSDSGGNKWSENCIVELRTPKKTQEVDEQIYYEASPSYKVVKQPSGELTHSVGATASDPIILTKGDVWFRRVATNVKPFQNGEFIDIIPDDDGADPSPQPNFTTIYMETPSFSDLFRSDSLSIGRPNVIFEDASETIRENTITYSDPSNPESTKLRYSSFNASLANFKDLSETFGGIQYMGDHGDFVVVIQRDNVSLVPVGKNILSDASGNQQLIASRNVLNEAVVYPGRSGCDIDPSSVFDSGTEVFFANKNLGEVYRWSKNTGPQVISDIGVSSVLRAILKKAVELNLNTISPNESRIVGGWDPFKKEYLLSVVDVESKVTTGVVLADQPNADTIAPGDADGNGDGGGDTNAPSGLTVSPTDIEFGELEVNKPETSVVSIVNNDPDFISITSITSNNPTYDVGNMVFPIMLFGAGSGISNEFNLTVNALALEEGDQNGTLEITTDNELQIRILLPITGSAVDAPEEVNLLPFTIAYNEYNNTSLTDEDMSVELAVDYISDTTSETVWDGTNHLTTKHLKDLIAIGETSHMNLFKADQDFNGLVGAQDLILFLSQYNSLNFYGGIYDENISVMNPPEFTDEQSKSIANKPKPVLTTKFVDVPSAVNYLIAQGSMTVGEYLQLRSFLRQEVALNMNQQGNVGALDLIDFLQVFGQQTENSDPAFLPSIQGGIPLGITAQEAIDWIIADGTMTIEQYFVLAAFVKPECKADSNQNNSLSTGDLITYLSVFGGPLYGEEGYEANDPAFQF